MNNQPSYIQSKENRWVKQIIRLREKKYRDKEKAFWIEGERAARELMQRNTPIQAFFIQEDHWEKWQTMITPAYWEKVYLVPPKLASYLSATETFAGIGLIVPLPQWNLQKIFAQRGTLLYLDHIMDPGNLGTMIRTAQAFDLNGILLSPGSVDPFNPKVVRSAMGMLTSFPVLTQVSGEELQKASQLYQFQITGATLKNGSENHYNHLYTEPQIIVIGSEAFGISTEIDKICHNYVKIPISFRAESLNAAVACGIIVSEIKRQQDTGSHS